MICDALFFNEGKYHLKDQPSKAKRVLRGIVRFYREQQYIIHKE